MRDRPSGPRAASCADSQGNILVTLLLVMSLSTIVLSGLFVSAIEWNLSADGVHAAQAFALAESGAQHAFYALRHDVPDMGAVLLGPDDQDGTADDGMYLGVDPVEIEGGTYSVRVVDNDDGDDDPFTDFDGVVYLFSTGNFREVSKAVRLTLGFNVDCAGGGSGGSGGGSGGSGGSDGSSGGSGGSDGSSGGSGGSDGGSGGSGGSDGSSGGSGGSDGSSGGSGGSDGSSGGSGGSDDSSGAGGSCPETEDDSSGSDGSDDSSGGIPDGADVSDLQILEWREER